MSNRPMPIASSPKSEPSTLNQLIQKSPAAHRDDRGRSTSASDEKREEDRDEVLRESFPASDPAPVSPGFTD